MQTTTTPAETSLAQINALDSWARARWGVRGIYTVDAGRTLQLDCGRGRKVLVTLDAATDTYTVRGFRLTRSCEIHDESLDGVHAEDLIRSIEAVQKKIG